MSHNKERAEKICLNCNTQLTGRYCQDCGQENIEPKENFGHLINHFFQDVTHFDGKFFSTLKLLLFKPGFLSKEYLRGKRVSYLHPVRMYIFTAFVFFFVLFSSRTQVQNVSPGKNSAGYLPEKDSIPKAKIDKDNDDDDTVKMPKLSFTAEKGLPNTIAAYDSIQSHLPKEKRDGWIRNKISKRAILLDQKYKNGEAEFWNQVLENFKHSFPKMMFVFLPLVALILQLLYLRRRKEFYYVSHGIFVIHFYIAAYILMLISLFFSWLHSLLDWGIFTFLNVISMLAIFFYLYKAMRNFYKEGRGKTILKYFIFNFTVLIVFGLLALALLAISLYQTS